MQSLVSQRRSSLTASPHPQLSGRLLVDIRELEHQIEHAKATKQYRKAQALEREAHQLKSVHEQAQLQELEHKQAEELVACDGDHQTAYRQLVEEWSSRQSGLQHQLQQAHQHLFCRQEQEKTALQAAQATYPARPKFSPALLNMRHIERTLAQQKEFVKADQVRRQADQLEQTELSRSSGDTAVRMEAERARLAAQQSKEREAAAKKATSAVLAAQQRQYHETEQLTRRFQAIKLALTRAHAAQRTSLQQSLRGSLGIKKPSKMLGLPSFNSSLAHTRSLVPEPALNSTGIAGPAPASPRVSSSTNSRCKSPVGDMHRAAATYSPVGGSRCRSPVSSPERVASPTGSSRPWECSVLCNPERVMHYDPYEYPSPAVCRPGTSNPLECALIGNPRRAPAAADAAAAAAGLGMVTMPAIGTASSRPATQWQASKTVKAQRRTQPYTSMGSRLPRPPAASSALQLISPAAGEKLSTSSFPANQGRITDIARVTGVVSRPTDHPQQAAAGAHWDYETLNQSCVNSSSNITPDLRPTTRHGQVRLHFPNRNPAADHSTVNTNVTTRDSWSRHAAPGTTAAPQAAVFGGPPGQQCHDNDVVGANTAASLQLHAAVVGLGSGVQDVEPIASGTGDTTNKLSQQAVTQQVGSTTFITAQSAGPTQEPIHMVTDGSRHVSTVVEDDASRFSTVGAGQSLSIGLKTLAIEDKKAMAAQAVSSQTGAKVVVGTAQPDAAGASTADVPEARKAQEPQSTA